MMYICNIHMYISVWLPWLQYLNNEMWFSCHYWEYDGYWYCRKNKWHFINAKFPTLLATVIFLRDDKKKTTHISFLSTLHKQSWGGYIGFTLSIHSQIHIVGRFSWRLFINFVSNFVEMVYTIYVNLCTRYFEIESFRFWESYDHL